MARECVNEYLETVGGQIRWRRARRVLLRELSDHIADQAAAFEAEGRSPEEALAGAVAEMGEPEAVGRELDRLHRPQNRRGLAVTVAALFAAGVLLQLFAAGLMGDAKDVFYFRRQVLGLLLAAGVLTGLWFSDYTLLLRRKWVPAAALLLFSLAPLWGLPFGWPFLSYKLMLYPTLLLPVPYAALVVSLRGRGTRAVLLCGGLALPLPIWAFVAISSTGYLVTLASMLLVLLAAVGLGWFRGKRRWNLLAALGPALTILPLLFLRHLEYAAWRIGAFLGPDLFYERLRMGELPSLFVGSSPELLLAETAQGLGRWVFWAAAGLIVLFAALLLRRIRALHSRTGSSSPCRPSFPCSSRRPSTGSITWAGGRWACSPPSCPTASSSCWWTPPWRGAPVVFRMDALVGHRLGLQRPVPRPSALDIPLGRGQLHIEYRKGGNTFKYTRRPAALPQASFLFLVRPVGHEHILPVLHAPLRHAVGAEVAVNQSQQLRPLLRFEMERAEQELEILLLFRLAALAGGVQHAPEGAVHQLGGQRLPLPLKAVLPAQAEPDLHIGQPVIGRLPAVRRRIYSQLYHAQLLQLVQVALGRAG
ncbi:MAG: permease prefix domain 1-containing protein [Flavonifractor plautii]